MDKKAFEKGDVFNVPYPFVRTVVQEFDGDKFIDRQSWRPGCEYETVGPYGDAEAYCHGMGEQMLTVVGTYKPEKYQTRVFYLTKWRTPDGNEFGRNSLKICTVKKFRRLTAGFMSHVHGFDFDVIEPGS